MLQFLVMRSSQRGFIWFPILIVLGLIIVGAGTYFVIHQNATSQQTQNQQTTNTQPAQQTQATNAASNSQNNEAPTITITNISGRTITVQYSGLSTTAEGPTLPSSLWIQNEGWSKPTLELSMDGATSGKITFTLPASAPDGNYGITPVGIPTKPHVGGVGPGYMAYGKTNAIASASFFLSPNGSVSSGSESASVPGMSKYTDADFGFSFWYPSGWSIKNGGLYASTGLIGNLACPPAAKGFEGSVPTTNLTVRSFQKNGLTYDISYQEFGGQDVNGKPTPTDMAIISWAYPASSTWNGGAKCMLSVGTTAPLPIDVISGVKEIYNSWQ